MSAYDDDLLDEEDEEMPLTERDLADDAAWKVIQKNTFSRWANEHLKTVNKTLVDLETDLSDGLRLVALVEVLSGKKFKHVNRRPNFRTQKLENVTNALRFLEDDEGIRIVNIDSGDIVDCKMKLILGLIWTLILHYSISMPMWEGEEPQPSEGGPTPKQRLLNWINSKVPDLPIKNFNTDWNDGKAIGALVDAIAPGLCPDWEDWDPKKAKKNAKEAMDAAEKWLDVPQLIKPDEITNPKIDDLSMMTYLSQFPNAKLKPGAPLRPRQNVGKVRAYGPGIEPKGNRVGQQAKFTVETFSAGQGTLDLKCLDPKGKELKCDSVYNNDRNMTYSCTYMPAQEGEHRIIIKFGEKEIHKSPFKVLVEGAAGDASKVSAAGPGLEKTGVSVNKKTYFEVFTKDAGKGTVEVVILDPSGHRDKIKPVISAPNKDGVYKVEYTATEIGIHSINISFSGTAIPKSPWGVNVGAAINPKAVYATGRGIQPRGVRVKQNAEFKVHTKDAGTAEVKVQIIGPGGVNINCTVKLSSKEEGVYDCVYIPTKVGQYVINITFGGQHITKSPFRVDVGPEKTTKIVAFGPGLESGVVNQPACFTVETNGEVGALGFSIEGPSQAKIDCKDNGDGSADVVYWPTAPGEYAVHILCNDEDIPQAPYMAQIQPATTAFDASKVIAKGPGLEKDGVIVNKPAEFTVDARNAGKAALKITCIDATYKVVEVTVIDKKDGTYACKYTPKLAVRHTIIITWGTVGVPKSPFRVNVSQPSIPGNVKVYGPGVERGVKTFVLTHFTVDCRSAGPGDVAIMLIDEKGQDVPVNTKDNKDGTFTIEYEPQTPGVYTVNVYFVGKEIPKSPIKVKVESSIDVGKVTVTGLEKPIPMGETRKITIITSGMPKKDGPCTVTVTTPKKKTVDLTPKKSPEGYTCDFKPTEEGPHKVEITYDKKPVSGSPFSVNVTSAKKPGEVEVKGLETPIQVGELRPITVVTTSMPKKDAPCKVTCTNPKGKTTDLPVKKSPEGYTTSLTPTEPGPHKVAVEYDKKPVPKSPFTVDVQPKGAKPSKPEPGKSEITVKGLDTPVQTGEKRIITVVTLNAAKKGAPCKITATNPKGRTTDLKPKPSSEGFEAVFSPWDSGMHKIKIEYDATDVPGSPFDVEVYKINLSAIIVKGLEKPIPLGETRHVNIITKDCGKPDLPCKVTAIAPSGQSEEVPTVKSPDGYTCDFTPKEPGEYKVQVEYASKPLPKSPYKVNVEVAEIVPEQMQAKQAAPNKAAPGKAAPKDAKEPTTGAVTVKGLDTPIKVGEPRPVLIDTSTTGAPDAPCRVLATNPRGQTAELPVERVPVGYATTFAPLEPGPHKVKVDFAGKEVPKSPFPVKVEPQVNVGAVKVTGLETPIGVAEPRPITIDTSSTGQPDAPCRVCVMNPAGQVAELPVKPVQNGYQTLFAPLEPGPHQVAIDFAEQPVPKSPFPVDVMDAGQVFVQGLETPIEVGEARPIQINTASTGKPDAPCRVTTTNPKGQTAELPTQITPEGYQTVFAPLEPGPHKVNVNFAEKEVPKSPFNVTVEPKIDLGAVEVLGLETPIKVGEPRPITVMTSTTGKPDAPCKVSVTNPVGQTMELPTRKIPEGYTATLAPKEAGPHLVNVDFNNQPVPKSPFNVMAEPAIDFSKVKVSGLEKPVEVGEIRPVTIETAECGVVDAPCQLTATNPVGQVRDLPVQKTPKGYEAQFAPLEEGPHLVAVKYANTEVPKSPFSVQATPQGSPASRVKAYGPGLEKGTATKPCNFTIDTRETTQPGGLGVTVEGPAESKIECRDNQDGTCDVTYYPTVPGEYSINITYADEHIPQSPFKAKIQPSGDIDVSGVKAYGPGLEPGVFLDSPTGFTVDAKSVTPNGEGKVRAIVTSPSGQKTESMVKNKNDGTYDVLYTPYEQGPNTIDITYEDIPIPESPVQVTATPGCDAGRVKAYGPGLEGGFTSEPQEFTVDVKGAGQGGLALAIDGPAETQINCKDNRDGTCCVEYVPVKPGDYDITVKFADQHIPGSPFHVGIKNPVNPAKVKCYGPGIDEPVVKTNAPATFTVDTTDAGEAPLDVTYTDSNGTPQPADIIPLEAGKYQATYYPVDEGKCKVEVKYANQQVPNSPFNKVVEPGLNAKKVKLSGDGIQPTVPASLPVKFVIDTREAGDAPIDVVIKRPDGTFIRPMIQDNGDGTFTCQYTPEDCGPYELSITFGDEPVTDAPIKTTAVPTGDATKCRITDGLQQTIPVAKETIITVDASDAGTGKVTCRIRSPTGAEIDIDIVENIDGTFSIMFTPAFQGDYSISIKFGGQSIQGGDYCVQVGDDLIQQETVDGVQAAAPGAGVYHPQEFCIPVGPIFNFCTAYIVMPSGKKAYPKIEDNKDGTVTVRYQPQETGLHELHVCYNQNEIQGSPFKFHVDAVNSGFVTAYGPGLSHGVVNVPAEFTIVTKDAGAGGLSLAIEGPSKTEIKCKDNEDGTCTVCYLPSAPGEYNITVKFADKNISGSPFVAKVTAGEPKQKAQIGRSSEVSLKVTETDIANLTASILSPSGHEEPCMLKRLPNGHLGISFTPRETGEHLVNVYRDGQHIANSPFRITVGESELGNASKVKVYGKGLKEAMAHEVNEFIVDTREAGYGGLSLSIEGPSKADIECHDNEDGTCRVTYKPTEPGVYIINIKFADEHVPGSPYKVKVGGEASEKITERIMRHREAADVTHVGSECELSLKIPGTSPFDMTASVTNPSGMTELCDVVSLDDCHYSIKFVPKEMGIHTVSVKHKDMHIPGSPFQFTVGPIAGGGAHKVHAAGMGLVRGEIEQPNEFNIYTREAGAGGLSIAVEGPSKAEVDFEDRKDGSCGVKYKVAEPGEYLISIKFNDEHIPDSPFRVPITPSVGDAKKLSVSALQSKGLAIGKPCTFVVNFNGAPKGKLQARVVSPSNTEVDALLQEIDDGEYAVRFIPRENGPHLVYVSFDGCQIPDSPFRIQVGTVHADPGMVQAYGEGLKCGKTDQTAKFIVNTVNAGSGALAVTVEGPSKVKMECKEVDDGYEFTYTPTAPGDYLITIKYAGTNIAGSPFKARVEGQGKATGYSEQASVVVETVTKTSVMSKFASLAPFVSDASKVTVDGNGLKKGYRNKQCTVNVDTSKAGNNMLFIGMIGPKGPCEELCVKHQPNAPYKITYLVKERGEYMLAVKWGEEHIPGSPFCVKVD